MGSWFALGLLIVAALVLFAQHEQGTIAGLDPSEFASMTALLAILIFLSGSLFGGYSGRIARAIRDGVMWAALGFALVAGYSYKDQILPYAQRVVHELVPGTPISVQSDRPGQSAVRIRKQFDGQFVAHAQIDAGGRGRRQPISMIVDTGASTVVLRPEDAKALGIDTARLDYSIPVRTANGTSFAARVRLKRIAVGSVQVANVEALIARPGALHHSLLGMSFLSRLRSYEFSGDFLTLRG
ncbi:MAG: TIGR02281 family clan AA aspartic protease [Alphaproteobacteria bacterium]|nr:MAG: TIGR02281 family clan AA aspartic protease [Alphaproteobacteria bacterium]